MALWSVHRLQNPGSSPLRGPVCQARTIVA